MIEIKALAPNRLRNEQGSGPKPWARRSLSRGSIDPMTQSKAPTKTTTQRPIGPRIRQEKRTIDAMLAIYCQDLHGGPDRAWAGLCPGCLRLQDYAHRRLDTCPFQEEKPVCNRCEVHCYSQAMREQVREVMRYAGPRMPLRHPWLALLHVLDKLRAVPQLARRVRRPQPPTR